MQNRKYKAKLEDTKTNAWVKNLLVLLAIAPFCIVPLIKDRVYLTPFMVIGFISTVMALLVVVNFLNIVTLWVENNTLIIKKISGEIKIFLDNNLKIKIQDKLSASNQDRKFDYFTQLDFLGLNKSWVLVFSKEKDRDNFTKDVVFAAGYKFDEVTREDKKIDGPLDFFKAFKRYKNQENTGHDLGVDKEDIDLIFNLLRLAFAVVIVGIVLYYIYIR
ncbi:hypothetical protein KJ785_01455 [Patescibacteria group bacterium]|nr:hypothetical protein [Patescibacteria group bacterium]